MYFVRGGGKLHKGEEIFPPGERKYFLPPGDSVTGVTLFRDTGTIFEEGGQYFFTSPPLLLNLPTLDTVFWVGKSALIVAHSNH